MEQVMIDSLKDDYGSPKVPVQIIDPDITVVGPWGVVKKGKFTVVVYDKNGKFKEAVVRTAQPRQSFGAFSVWAVRYKGKTYTTLVSDMYNCIFIVEGKYNT